MKQNKVKSCKNPKIINNQSSKSRKQQKLLASCIMPTFNRRLFVPRAISCFLAQDYPNKELIILDDGTDSIADLVPDDKRIYYMRLKRRFNVGQKRNLACTEAHGDIIVHWDDDDWSAPDRLSYQIGELTSNKAELCGTQRVLYWNTKRDQAWWYTYPYKEIYLSGNTLCYRRVHWQKTRFRPVQVGEDILFVRDSSKVKSLVLDRQDFVVACIHQTNVSPKRITSQAWQSCPITEIRRIMGDHSETSGKHNNTFTNTQQLVSCIMPTFNRRHFVPLAINYFLRQAYPNLELIVIDDGPSVRDLIPKNPRIRYIRLPSRVPLGMKRNLAVQQARGDIIVHWDDDDWHASTRISEQVAPIVSGETDATFIDMKLVIQLQQNGKLYRCSEDLHRRLHGDNGCPGTLAYRKEMWGKARYPAVQIGEDIMFIQKLKQKGGRIKRLSDTVLIAAVRHGKNTWDKHTDWSDGLVDALPEDYSAIGKDLTLYNTLGKEFYTQEKQVFNSPINTTIKHNSVIKKRFQEATFIISLARVKERREHMIRQVAIHSDRIHAEFIDGVDGREVDVSFFRQNQLIREAPWLNRMLRHGEIGCWLSHVKAIRTILKRRINCALIFEDDVCLDPEFAIQLNERLEILYKTGINYHLLMLDCFEGLGGWAPKAPNKLIKGGFFRLGISARGCPGARGYIITREGALKWLKYLCSRPIDQPIDEVIREQSEKDLKVICAHPSFLQGSGLESLSWEQPSSSENICSEYTEEYMETIQEYSTNEWWK
jgi:glycosyltransferase involved in cell wall biosynthesis/GR25 family glycosyltransferase involved in LPS biosynthesis